MYVSGAFHRSRHNPRTESELINPHEIMDPITHLPANEIENPVLINGDSPTTVYDLQSILELEKHHSKLNGAHVEIISPYSRKRFDLSSLGALVPVRFSDSSTDKQKAEATVSKLKSMDIGYYDKFIHSFLASNFNRRKASLLRIGRADIANKKEDERAPVPSHNANSNAIQSLPQPSDLRPYYLQGSFLLCFSFRYPSNNVPASHWQLLIQSFEMALHSPVSGHFEFRFFQSSSGGLWLAARPKLGIHNVLYTLDPNWIVENGLLYHGPHAPKHFSIPDFIAQLHH